MEKKFVRLLVDHYTKEGWQVKKYDEEDADANHTFWNVELIEAAAIQRITETSYKPGNTLIILANGDSMITKGKPEDVLMDIEKQLLKPPFTLNV